MDHTVAEEYKSSLNDLNFNSKPLINMLTMLAEENKKHAALITSTIVNHINSVSPESKLPGLYLVDSIMKNVGEHYLKIFCHHITSLFTSVFEKVDETTRSLMFKLRQTWNDILPNKILYNLDTSVKKLDPAWPVTAKNVPKKILVHPNIRCGTAEQKSNLNSQCISQKEDKPKPNTDVLLKKLLADQEQLRQIEMKKVQQTMKKKPLVCTGSVHGKVLKQNQIQDPKMVKIIKTSPIIMSLKGNSNIAQRKTAPVNVNTSSPALEELAVTRKPLLLQSASFTMSVPENFNKSSVSQNAVKFSDQQVSSQKKCSEKSKRKPQSLENESLKNTTLTKNSPIHKYSRSQIATSFNNPLDLLHKKVTERTKNEKINAKKNKSDVSCKNKCASELKINFDEKVKSFNKADRCQNKSKILNNDLTKNAKCSPKKKAIPSSSSKLPELSSNTRIDPRLHRDSESKISKKREKVKPLTCTDILPIVESKVSITEDKSVNSLKNENIKQNAFPIPNETFDKCILPPNETVDIIQSNTQPVASDLNYLSLNDKDLRIGSTNDKNLRIGSTNDKDLRIVSTHDNDLRIASTNDKDLTTASTNDKDFRICSTNNKDLRIGSTNDNDLRIGSANDNDLRIGSTTQNILNCLKVPISEVKDSVTTKETDKGEPPQKKIKIEDVENLNPDQRKPDSPVLFGNEDQDLRKLKENPILTDDLKEHQAVSVSQKIVEEMFMLEKEQPTNFPNQKYITRYPPRGRYINRPILRSDINRQCLYDANIGSMIKQAEEKYKSGKISEKEYADLRHELQKMLESSEYDLFKNSISRLQAVHNQQTISEAKKHVHDYHHRSNIPSVGLPIQGPSLFRPAMKPFVLDNKSRFIYFIEDRAFVLMDNDEPRELTFADEPRKVIIEGLMEPLTLGFNGKSVEFEVDGRRHIVRFGVPGHEIYINNHPYEANFGGPPIKAMLEDGCVYKISLMGPPPQVIIGSKPEYELFSKYHRNIGHSLFKKLPEISELKSEVLDSAPVSSGALQDVDMRIKPENAQQSDVLLSKDSPFYSEDLKDVDWRIPSSNNLVIDKNIPDLFPETEKIVNVESWSANIKQEMKKFPYTEEENEPVTSSQEPRTYEWDASTNSKNVSMNVDEREHFISPNHETWHLKEDDNINWRHKEHSRTNHPGHSVHYQTYPVQCDSTEHLNDQDQEFASFNRNIQFIPYPRRPMFHNRRMRGRVRGHGYGPWISNNNRNRPFRSRGRPPLLNDPAIYRKTPLTSFHARPYVPLSEKFILPPPAISTTRGFAENYDGSLNVFRHKPSESQSIEPSSLDVNINVESLLEKLIAAGIINAKPDEEPSPEVTSSDCVDTDTISESSENIPNIELNVESLRVRHTGVPSALHSGSQCATCGMRFKEMQGEHYSRHLDWHFRMNRRERDGAKKVLSKRWYGEIEDWIQFEEFEDFEERVPSYFELEAENEQSEIVDLPVVLSVSATNNDDESCPICQEQFQLFWVEEEEEWHLRNAVRHDNVTYHPACYEDFKKASEAEKAAENDSVDLESGSDELLCDISDVVPVLLNELLEKLCIDEEKIRISNEESLPVCSNTMVEVSLVEREEMSSIEMEEVPPVEMEEASCLEEVILEGKPGEEEIIGVISESDIEAEIELPRTETKMVIMQSGGITLKVKAESLQCHSPLNISEKDSKPTGDKALEADEIDFRPPTPDPNFKVMTPVTKGRELSGLCSIM